MIPKVDALLNFGTYAKRDGGDVRTYAEHRFYRIRAGVTAQFAAHNTLNAYNN